LLRKEISVIDVIKSSAKYVFSALIMFLISIFLGKFIKNNLLSIICQVLSSSIVYFGLLLLLKDKIIFMGENLIKNKMKKFIKIGE